MKEDLASPTEFDSKGNHCFIVGKDGNTTDLTIRHYAGLVSFTLNDVGIRGSQSWLQNIGFKGHQQKKILVIAASQDLL